MAIKQDSKFLLLLEVKAIGAELKDLLTNGESWRAYKLVFGKPVTSELVLEINFSALQGRRDADLEMLYRLTREGWMSLRSMTSTLSVRP